MFPCPMVIGFCSSGSESPSPLVMRHCLLGDREIYPLDSFEYHEHGRDKKKNLINQCHIQQLKLCWEWDEKGWTM